MQVLKPLARRLDWLGLVEQLGCQGTLKAEMGAAQYWAWGRLSLSVLQAYQILIKALPPQAGA